MNPICDKIFQYLKISSMNEEMKNKIKMICVPPPFRSASQIIYFITESDDFYAFLSIENKLDKINILSNLNVIKITFSENYLVALNQIGDVYFWNGNTEIEMINSSINKLTPLIGLCCPIIDIYLSPNHLIIMTQLGEAFSCDPFKEHCNNTPNYFMQGNNMQNNNNITLLNFDGFDKQIIAISSDIMHTYIVNEHSQLFYWENRILKLNSSSSETHTFVSNGKKYANLVGIKMKKLTSSFNHTMLLSKRGDIYTIGCYVKHPYKHPSNYIYEPVKLTINLLKFKNIFVPHTSKLNGISVALGMNNKFYVWGKNVACQEIKTDFESIYEIYGSYDPICTWDFIKFETSKFPHNNDKKELGLALSFNEQMFSDIKFKFDDKYIYAHKIILFNRSEHFKSVISEEWEKNSENIEITKYSYEVFYAFLKYIYTGCVEIDFSNALSLYDVANSYFENELKLKCLQVIENGINPSNFFTFYDIAVNMKIKQLEEFCLDYGMKNINDILKNKEPKQNEHDKSLSHFFMQINQRHTINFS